MRSLGFQQCISACAAVGFVFAGTTVAPAHTPAEAMAEAATRFLAALDDQQRADAQFEFTDDERLNWQFIPMERAGLPLKRHETASAAFGDQPAQ